MNLRINLDKSNINWDEASEVLQNAGINNPGAEVMKKAFENSYVTVFAYDDDKLIGVGRAISDGVYQAAVYDVAVLPEYQGKKIGSKIVEKIMESLPTANFILYASYGKEGFYEKLGFSRMKTGMAHFYNTEVMKKKGFI